MYKSLVAAFVVIIVFAVSMANGIASCLGNVTLINPAIGGTVHVTIVDQNCNPVTPSGVNFATVTPNPSGFLQVTVDSTGLNFKGLAAGQFNYTLTYPVGPTPFPSTPLAVVVGSMPTSISVTSP